MRALVRYGVTYTLQKVRLADAVTAVKKKRIEGTVLFIDDCFCCIESKLIGEADDKCVECKFEPFNHRPLRNGCSACKFGPGLFRRPCL